MVTLASIEEQLRLAGCSFRFWGRAELKELCEILLPGETIAQAVNGQYEGGFAMLCATDFRVLLIDKKPKYLTLKDVRYDMITELDFAGRMLNSTIRIYTPNKELRFTAPSNKRLRKLFTYTQHKVMELRNHVIMQQFQQQHEIKNTPPALAMQGYAPQLPPGAASDNAALPQQTAPAVPIMPIAATTPVEPTNLYNPDPVEHSDEHKRLAAAMGAAGLRSIVHNGQVIKEYMTVPFAQRWRKRPYGFTRDSLPQANQQ